MSTKWGPELETGIEEIDRQHKRLFERVYALLEALQEKRSRAAVKALLDFFYDYFTRHVESEEDLMKAFDYGELARHEASHREIQLFLNEIKRAYESSNGHYLVLSIKLSVGVTRYLHGHIEQYDIPMAAFLKAQKQLKPSA